MLYNSQKQEFFIRDELLENCKMMFRYGYHNGLRISLERALSVLGTTLSRY